jgi:hypothetical protein
MVSAAKVYRKEDIIEMSEMAVLVQVGGLTELRLTIYGYTKAVAIASISWMRKTYRAVDVKPDVKTQTQK